MIKNKKIVVSIDFRDWKWISNFERFQAEITDQGIILGQKAGTIEIDFSKLQKSDFQKKSKFLVAGRVYFEAHAFGHNISSFTSSGFIDIT